MPRMKKRAWFLLIGPWLLAGEAQAAPTVITSCQAITQPGAYVLGNNLSASGNCIRLKADGVTLNLNGFQIVGNGSGTGIKFAAECGCAGRQIVIQHGLIIGFARAIDLEVLGGGPTTYVLEDLRISDNAEFGARLEGESMVRNSVFYKNGHCLFLDGCARPTEPGDGLTVGNNSIVTGNILVGNAHSGIVAGASATITGNTVNSNGFIGISAGGGATLVNNTVNANANAGISVACPSNLQANTATANTPNVSTSVSATNAPSMNTAWCARFRMSSTPKISV